MSPQAVWAQVNASGMTASLWIGETNTKQVIYQPESKLAEGGECIVRGPVGKILSCSWKVFIDLQLVDRRIFCVGLGGVVKHTLRSAQ